MDIPTFKFWRVEKSIRILLKTLCICQLFSLSLYTLLRYAIHYSKQNSRYLKQSTIFNIFVFLNFHSQTSKIVFKMKIIFVVAAILAVASAEEYCSNDAVAGCKGQTGMLVILCTFLISCLFSIFFQLNQLSSIHHSQLLRLKFLCAIVMILIWLIILVVYSAAKTLT